MRVDALGIFLFVFAAVIVSPVQAQVISGIPEKCVLTRDMRITINIPETPDVIVNIIKDTAISSNQSEISGNVELRTLGRLILAGGDASKAIAGKWGVICLINTINVLSDWAFFIILTISFVFIAVAGFMWLTSVGNPERQGTAGKMILAALVGIVISIIARMVPAVLTGILL